MELLNALNNIGKYKLDDMYNKNICIYIESNEVLIELQSKIYEYNSKIQLLKNEHNRVCINIEDTSDKDKELMICWCDKEYYERKGFEIIEVEDIIWE